MGCEAPGPDHGRGRGGNVHARFRTARRRADGGQTTEGITRPARRPSRADARRRTTANSRSASPTHVVSQRLSGNVTRDIGDPIDIAMTNGYLQIATPRRAAIPSLLSKGTQIEVRGPARGVRQRPKEPRLHR